MKTLRLHVNSLLEIELDLDTILLKLEIYLRNLNDQLTKKEMLTKTLLELNDVLARISEDSPTRKLIELDILKYENQLFYLDAIESQIDAAYFLTQQFQSMDKELKKKKAKDSTLKSN